LIHLKIILFICTRQFKNFKGRILKSIITWSEIGRQTAQSKKVYSNLVTKISGIKQNHFIHSFLNVDLISYFLLLPPLLKLLTKVKKTLPSTPSLISSQLET